MSLNRENVIWKSKDGNWYRGFWDYVQTGDDYEWDVEYLRTFNWASGPFHTKEEAHRSWNGANPGGYWLAPEPGDETDEYDCLFGKFQEEAKKRSKQQVTNLWSHYRK